MQVIKVELGRFIVTLMEKSKTPFYPVLRLQLLASVVIATLLILIVVSIYGVDRGSEWSLRTEQADHRLELGFVLISRDLRRVRADVKYLASQPQLTRLDISDADQKNAAEVEFMRMLECKPDFDQLRLIDMQGRERVRVEAGGESGICVVPEDELQNKLDRYYVRESLSLRSGEVFVSDFDLNEERGSIERPLNPVIRFVTPVSDKNGQSMFLLVANYRGSGLLNELSSISLPGKTLVVRDDGQYLLARNNRHEWGWLLGHEHSFANNFPNAWEQARRNSGLLNSPGEGAFAFREIRFNEDDTEEPEKPSERHAIFLISSLTVDEVFSHSRQLFQRLLVFLAAAMLPLLFLSRLWALGKVRREQQHAKIVESEMRLRELSGRLVKIQEDERKAISRELHDELGQQVTAINLDLKMAQRETDGTVLTSRIERAIAVGEELLRTLHDFATRVRPAELDDLGLHDAVESHLELFSQRSGIKYTFHSDLKELKIREEVAGNVFRLVQESLNNVFKHANASEVVVSIQVSDTELSLDGEQLVVRIQDNGIGVADEIKMTGTAGLSISNGSRLGILGMRERVELLGGQMHFGSSREAGTKVEFLIPKRVVEIEL